MSFTRNLTFQWSNIPENMKLLLCFNKLTESKLTSEQNYIAWKVIEVRKGDGSATVHYSGRVGFAQSEMDEGKIVRGLVSVEMPLGAHVELVKEDTPEQNIVFGPVAVNAALGTLVTTTNKTGMKQDMSVGTFTSNKHNVLKFEPAFQWKDVGENISVKADFHPTLIAYVGYGYQKNQLITADLSGSEIWTENLAKLGNDTRWDLLMTEQGGFKIVKSE